MKRRVLSYVLAAAMVLTLCPSGISVLAETKNNQTDNEQLEKASEMNTSEKSEPGSIENSGEENVGIESEQESSGESDDTSEEDSSQASTQTTEESLTESEEGSEDSSKDSEVSSSSEEQISQESENSADEITIFHTNDIHGAFAGEAESGIDIAKAAALKEETENALLVDVGDATQGGSLMSSSKGAAAVDIMNAAGYDLMEVGEHDFDYGLDQLLSNINLAEFPVIASNVYRDGSPLFSGTTKTENNGENTVVTVGDKKIGFFGLLTTDTDSLPAPDTVASLEFCEEVETAKEQIDWLEDQGVDAIVALCHMGDQSEKCTSSQLAEALTGEYQDKVDVILDGHSHSQENKVENDILIVQAGSSLSNLGKVTLRFLEGDQVEAEGELLTEQDLADVVPDTEVEAKIAKIQEAGESSEVKHTITYVLNGGTNHPDNPESFLESETVKLKDASREGYRFLGWYRDEKLKDSCDQIPEGTTENITLYAKWGKDRLEPNDTWKNAVKIRIPSKTESYISSEKDVDYFKFTVSKTDRIDIRLTQPDDTNVYYDLILYDEEQNVLQKSQMNLDQSIVKTLEKGTYYIRIASLNGQYSREAYTLRASRIASSSLDFSEQNMLTQSLHPDSPYAYTNTGSLNSGGNYLMSTAYFARWSGPVMEEEDPYPEYTLSGGGFTPWEDDISVLTELEPKYHMQNAIWLPEREDALDNDYIKSAIYTYGGVDAYYLDAARFRNEETASIYVPELTQDEIRQYGAGGHEITLVGWDDHYSRENFGEVQPPGDGAFVFKNSWGSDGGEDGYYYLSYYSADLLLNPGALYFMEEGTDNYNTIYQYDPMGYVGSIAERETGSIYGANVFTAKSDEALRAISFISNMENVNYELYVEIGGERQKVANGSVRYAGYKTVRLQNEIPLQEGEEFTVILKLSSDSGIVRMPLEYPLAGYSEKADSEEGISWISNDGENWEDLSKVQANPCIKAFTYDADQGSTFAEGVNASVNINNGTMKEIHPESLEMAELEEAESSQGDQEVTMTEDGKALGAQEARLKTEVSQEEAPISGLPSQFDLREIDAVTPVKDQYDLGACWTFGAMGSAESILLRNENASYSYPLDIQVQGEKTIVLTEENPTFSYSAAAELSTNVAATDVITWELTGDLDSVEQAEQPLRSSNGESILLFTAKKAGTITLTAVSAADETRSDTIMITIQDERTQVTPTPEDTPEPKDTPQISPTQSPEKTVTRIPVSTKKPSRTEEKDTSSKAKDPAKTGDETPVETWMGLLICAMAAAGAVVIRRRQKP